MVRKSNVVFIYFVKIRSKKKKWENPEASIIYLSASSILIAKGLERALRCSSPNPAGPF